ncbi:hypothetical protein QAD02_003707 [Eretmocerus hayati]|uniref:Uncharacterized protein n=1 Tax=Eretmocerus hayati TaxID=131215 RepID=A0ACC2NNK4_9HYME|nr:hypothetical protein QAD02_003707 [Eretmocerus hayati]
MPGEQARHRGDMNNDEENYGENGHVGRQHSLSKEQPERTYADTIEYNFEKKITEIIQKVYPFLSDKTMKTRLTKLRKKLQELESEASPNTVAIESETETADTDKDLQVLNRVTVRRTLSQWNAEISTFYFGMLEASPEEKKSYPKFWMVLIYSCAWKVG